MLRLVPLMDGNLTEMTELSLSLKAITDRIGTEISNGAVTQTPPVTADWRASHERHNHHMRQSRRVPVQGSMRAEHDDANGTAVVGVLS